MQSTTFNQITEDRRALQSGGCTPGSRFQRHPDRGGFLARFVRALTMGLEVLSGTTSRRAFIAKIEACSDAELAVLGIRRNQIPRYVHCDLFYA